MKIEDILHFHAGIVLMDYTTQLKIEYRVLYSVLFLLLPRSKVEAADLKTLDQSAIEKQKSSSAYTAWIDSYKKTAKIYWNDSFRDRVMHTLRWR